MISPMKNGGLAILALAILLFPACSNPDLVLQENQKKTMPLNCNGPAFTLQKIQEGLRATYPAVKQISTAGLVSLLKEPQNILLLDVREPQEYAVSHLPGAIQIEPLDRFDQSSFQSSDSTLRGKTVVLYCSVGLRSSRMAQKLQVDLRRRGTLEVYNLSGGIFAWHNEDRILVNQNGPTQFVHPFNDKYKQLLRRQELARFQP